jgi:hypothetical protein
MLHMVRCGIRCARSRMLQPRVMLAAISWALAGSAGLYSLWSGYGPTRGARASRACAAGTPLSGVT